MECPAMPYVSGRFDKRGSLRPGGAELTVRALCSAGFKAGQRILDLGCGDGAGAQALQCHGCEVIGLDISPVALQLAGTRVPALATLSARAHQLPFGDDTLDGILCECALSLFHERDQALAECRRVLRPGCCIAITDLFARAEDKVDLPACLAGLEQRESILARIAAAGLRMLRWEDHTPALRAFVARTIFERGSLDALWADAPHDPAAMHTALRRCRPGYYLLIAAKAGRSCRHVG